VDPGDIQELLSEIPHLPNMDVAEPGRQWHGRRAVQLGEQLAESLDRGTERGSGAQREQVPAEHLRAHHLEGFSDGVLVSCVI
jgi:hypothetical protein